MQKKLKIFFLFILSLMLLPAVYANAGIILIVLFVPPLILSLIPIILIEAITYKHFLRMPFLKTLFPVSLANVITTLIGLPLSWIVFGYIQQKMNLYLQVFSESEYFGINTVLNMFIQPGWILGFLLAFFISVFLEYHVLRYFFRKMKKKEQLLKQVVWKANIYSYLFLILLTVLWYILAGLGVLF